VEGERERGDSVGDTTGREGYITARCRVGGAMVVGINACIRRQPSQHGEVASLPHGK
jgi:hypothetical protein